MKLKKFFLWTIFIWLLLTLAGYLLLAIYYRSCFGPNTWINGVYCTGKSAEEVNLELLSHVEAPSVVITDGEGNACALDFAGIDYTCDFLAPLNRCMKEQNPCLWLNDIAGRREHELMPAVYAGEAEIRKLCGELPFMQEELSREAVYELRYSEEEGYCIYNGLTNRLDVEKVYDELSRLLAEGGRELDLKAAGCYYDMALPEGWEAKEHLWQKVEAFQQCDIVYDMGSEQIPITPALAAGFLKKDDSGRPQRDGSGSLILDEENVAAFVASLAEEYDTYGKAREFQSTRGDLVTIEGGTYGTTLDQEAEAGFLMGALLSPEAHCGQPMEHIPAYEREGVARGKNDIGSTYIEVDMTEQKLYYYAEGELKLETDIVTGNTGRRMGTPAGVNFVYSKAKNRVLRGPGYASPVKYWMPVKGNIGIHDANWRSEFGGTIYKTNGSHGCINTPSEKMAELYDMVEIGTPVVMFY